MVRIAFALVIVLSLSHPPAIAGDSISEAFGSAVMKSEDVAKVLSDKITREIEGATPLGKTDGKWIFVIDLVSVYEDTNVFHGMDAELDAVGRAELDELISLEFDYRPPQTGILFVPEEFLGADFLASKGIGGHVPWDDLNDLRRIGCWPILIKGAIWIGGAIAGGALWDGIKWLADGGDCEGNDAAPCNFPDFEPDEGDGGEGASNEGGCSPDNWNACLQDDGEDDNDSHGDSGDGGVIDPGWQDLVELSASLPETSSAQLVTHSGLCIQFSH